MDSNRLSREQWQFLAVLDAIGEPVHIDVAGAISPILPGSFLELLPGGENRGWITETEKGKYTLSGHLSHAVEKKIERLNHAKAISRLVRTIQRLGLTGKISRSGLINLYAKAGECIPAARAERELALEAAGKREWNRAYVLLHNCVRRLKEGIGTPEADKLFLLAVLDLSSLCFSLGKATRPVLDALNHSRACAKRVGDRRSLALVDLHTGCLLHVSGRHVQALSALSGGLQSVKALGDKDIKEEAAVYIGIYYYIQGRFKTAIIHFEQALNAFRYGSGSFIRHPAAPILYGYCSAYLGDFNTGIASLECNRRLAEERSDFGLAATLQAILGTILVLIDRPGAGKVHLDEALDLARHTENALALYLARGGLALKHFNEGSIRESFTLARETVYEGSRAGFVFQYSSPWILEMFYTFHRKGYVFPGIDLKQEFAKITQGVNKHLKGVYYRLQTKSVFGEKQVSEALSDLQTSIDLLKHSGDKVQLAKSWFEVARLKKRSGEPKSSRTAAKKGWKLIQPYGGLFFPGDLSDILTPSDRVRSVAEMRERFLKNTLKIMEEIPLSEDRETILSGIVKSVTRLLSAERGALLEFHRPSGTGPVLKAGYFILGSQFDAPDFRIRRNIVKQAFQTKKIMTVPGQFQENNPGVLPVGSIVCLPVKLGKKTAGVLYHENSYHHDLFSFLDKALLKQVQRHIGTCIDRYINFGRLKWERNILASEKNFKEGKHQQEDMVTQSPVMKALLQKADKAAQSDSTVLITGETGVGKELLAKRLHNKSHRCAGPFIVIDLSSVPESLIESELFGHEKGAFTGADHQRRGRVELAHEGTLFIDEIGEISKYIQVKLLRTLQEKTFSRVGGTRVIKSDFRLLAATNRRLEKEVSEGRFRKDLYYRLNVIPVSLPPLRHRGPDINLLAEHYVKMYAKRYAKKILQLSRQDRGLLNEYHWPGNIRELKNVIERAVALSSDDHLEIRLPSERDHSFQNPFSDLPSMDDLQRRYILYVLERTRYKKSGPGGAADILGMKRQTLYARMKKLEISIKGRDETTAQ